MALSAATVWEVRSSGDDTNGGAFVAGASGVDRSQQDAAQTTYTDLVIDAVTNTNVTSAGNPFTANDVGNILNITSGTGFTTGRYQVVSQAAGVATLDRAVGTVGSTGGNGKLGGALASPGIAAASIVNGNTVWCRGTLTISSNTNNIANGNAQFGAQCAVMGYGSTRGDQTKAIFNVTHSSTGTPCNFTASHCRVLDIRVQTSSATGHGFSLTSFCTAVRCEADGFNQAGNDAGFNMNSSAQALGCLAEDCGTGFNGPAIGCTAKGCVTGFSAQSGVQFSHCLALSCTGDGFSNNDTNATFDHCVAYDCVDGFYRGSGNATKLVNCLSVGNSGFGFESDASAFSNATYRLGCAAYDNGGGDSDGTFSDDYGFITLTADPFVNAAGEDFRLNDDVGGGLELQDSGFPSQFPGTSTANHSTVGAAGPELFGSFATGGQLYPLGKKKLLDADIDLLADDIKAAFVLDTYTYSGADEFLDDVDVATNGATSNLSSKSTTGGVFDAADASATPDTSQDVNAVVLYKDTGSAATSPLIAYITGFSPFTTTGAAVPLAWSNGDAKIFRIADV